MTSPSNATADSTRRVRVDDTDASIQYDGPWSVDTTGSQDRIGNYGGTFQRSLHGVIGTTANFSFPYEGTGATVFGTVHVSNSSGSADPIWHCFLDGRQVAAPDTIPFPENNWRMCDFNATGVSAGRHTVLVQVISSHRHFWLDHIDYVPSPSPTTTTQNTFVSISNRDPAIVYDDSWMSLYVDANLTSTPGSTMTMTFNGTGIDWYGMIPTEMNHGSSISTYSLDGEPPTQFTLRGIVDNPETSVYNQRFFSTPDRPLGTHNITVTYLGNRTPLTLTNLIIRDNTAPNSQTQTTNVMNSPSTPSPSSDAVSSAPAGSSGPSPGAIAGTVIGVLIAVGLLIAGFIFGRRWYRKRSRPVIQPMPGFVPRSSGSAPLDLDIPTRYSVELEERMQQYGHLPLGSPWHIRRRSRTFNPEVRDTITSMDFDAPPVQHAPPSTSNPDRDSVLSDAPPTPVDKDTSYGKLKSKGKSSLNQETTQIGGSGSVTRHAHGASTATSSGYGAGYPYATDTSGLSNYEQLVAATKAEEARLREQRNGKSTQRLSYI